MDITPIVYAVLTVAILATILRVRKVTIDRGRTPRIHRSTYQK